MQRRDNANRAVEEEEREKAKKSFFIRFFLNIHTHKHGEKNESNSEDFKNSKAITEEYAVHGGEYHSASHQKEGVIADTS